MTNISVDWKAFEYKFSQDPMSAFEKLATTLFCYEMGISKGVFDTLTNRILKRNR